MAQLLHLNGPPGGELWLLFRLRGFYFSFVCLNRVPFNSGLWWYRELNLNFGDSSMTISLHNAIYPHRMIFTLL